MNQIFQALTSKTLALVLLIAYLQIPVSQCNANQVQSTCTPECSAGFECVLGVCKRQTCTRDCNSAPKEAVCGSNGVTYSNQCELEKAKCELMQDISLEHTGACSCSAHQKQFDKRSWEEFTAKCNLPSGYAKYSNGTLELRDVINCHRPQCNPSNTDQYLLKQCSLYFPGYCWCSSHDGYTVSNTFQRNMPEGYCSSQQKCEVDGQKYDDGEIFSPPSVCGLCECDGDTYSCFINYTFNDSLHLSNGELDTLKRQIVQVFDFQFNNSNNVANSNNIPISSVREVLKTLLLVPSSKKETVLRWKFNEYNTNRDSFLSSAEEYVFHKELREVFGCSTLSHHLNELFDEDKNNEITLQEWFAFFGLSIQETSGSAEPAADQMTQTKSKREASIDLRKPLHQRRKFRYTLS